MSLEKTQDVIALKPVLAGVIEHMRVMSDCQCVGIRLNNNGDYPYIVKEGFPEFFVQKENSLCAKNRDGTPILDDNGNPLLECMCGNVLQGRVNPKLEYFTDKGSFWTNSTTQLLKTTTEKDRQGRTRNMCNRSGYESVALIALRVGNKTLGLIQLNDPRENMFTLKMIKKYESIAEHVGAVVYSSFEIQEQLNVISQMVNETKGTQK
ncbi:MAG: hypothetical protein WC325_10390 [Candidatus Bathyarchaeia archaeon]|jgi:hypothetical protein